MKYVYGTGFALLVGFLAFLILEAYVQVGIALMVFAVITGLCILPGAKLMEGQTVRESLLGKDSE